MGLAGDHRQGLCFCFERLLEYGRATYEHVAHVEGYSLARGDGALGLVEDDLDAILPSRADRGLCGRRGVPDLGHDAHGLGEGLKGHEVEVVRVKGV